MKRSREHQRSGLFRKKRIAVRAQTVEEIWAVLAEVANSSTPARISASAFDLINQIEAQALAVYGKNGLPTVQGAYWREGPGSPWLAMSLAAGTGGEWQSTGLSQRDYGEAAHLSELAKYDHPEDTEVGFASTMLRCVGTARRALTDAERAGIAAPPIAFKAGAELILAWTKWREEFALAGWIAPEVQAQKGRSFGGDLRARQVRAERSPQWAEWQAEAERIWTVNPALSKTAVATLVVSRLRLREGERTVRNRISKPERC